MTATPTPAVEQQTRPLPPRRVIQNTALSLLLPGLGHLRQRQHLLGALLAGGFLATIAASIYHFVVGLTCFETALGAFLFGVLIRSAVMIWGFAAVDTYFRGTAQGDAGRRTKTVANFLLPGAGYLLDRAWLRAASSALVLIVVVYIARLPSRYLPLIFIGFRLITAFGIYQQLVTANFEANRNRPSPPPVDQVAAGQVILLVELMAVTALVGWTLMIQVADYPQLHLDDDDVAIRRRQGTIVVTVPKRNLTLSTPGQGWKIRKGVDGGAFFRARHRLGATLVAGMQPLLPFVRPERYLLALRRQITSAGYHLERQQSLDIRGLPATQLRFSRRAGGMILDRWAIAVPHGRVAYVLLLSCGREICEKLLPSLEKTRDSLRIADTPP